MREPELSVDGVTYRWQEPHFDLPTGRGWAHDGVAVLADGRVVASLVDRAALAVFEPGGRLLATADTDLVLMHGMSVVADDGVERLWVADPGSRSVPAAPRYASLVRPGRAVQLGLDGVVRREVGQPAHPAYENAGWKPCAVAVDEPERGGSGDIFVADGYGQSLVHRYDAAGRYLGTLDGTESGLAFDTPHGVVVDRRRGAPELYVADRGNRRIVVYGLDGTYRRVVGTPQLSSPSAFAIAGELLYVAELFGAVAVLDAADTVLGKLGARDLHDRPGWPNGIDDAGNTVRYPDLAPGRFHSPHGVAADPAGNVYVAEWLIGGRLVRLARV